MIASKILKFVVEHNINAQNCVKLIGVDFIKSNPGRMKNRMDAMAKADLRASIIKFGFLDDELLIAVPDRRDNNKFVVIDGNERMEIIRSSRPDISHLPCLILPVSLAKAVELLQPVNWQCSSSKKHSLLEILLVEIDKSFSLFKTTKISNTDKKYIALRAGFSAANPESINRALVALRAVYRDLCRMDPENLKLKFSEVINKAVTDGEPTELVRFAADGKPHPFKTAYFSRTRKNNTSVAEKHEIKPVDTNEQVSKFGSYCDEYKFVEVGEYIGNNSGTENFHNENGFIFDDLALELDSLVEKIENNHSLMIRPEIKIDEHHN